MFITAKFSSICCETGRTIKKGERCFWDATHKTVFSSTSERYITNDEREARSTADCVQANEDAFFDNFCMNNNI